MNFDKQKSYSSSSISIKLDSSVKHVNESLYFNELDPSTNEKTNIKFSCVRKDVYERPREMKSKYGVSYPTRVTKVTKQHPLSKRKCAPVPSYLTNASAKVVLHERNVEIKDLESKVKYLQNRIKELENENKVLLNVQSRQERELKKFKEGVADIPSLLRSHREEVKVYVSTISNIRRELKDCQKEIKLRNEAVLRKESQIDKLNVMIKQSGKVVQDYSSEIKELKTFKKDLEEQNKMLVGENKNLKCENDGLHKKIKEKCSQIENLEEDLSMEADLNIKLKTDLEKLQQKCEKHSVCKDQGEDSTEILLEGKNEQIEDSLVEESNEKVQEDKSSGDKAQKDLIDTFNYYKNLYNHKWSKSISHVSKAGNLKLLPPLKECSEKHLQDTADISVNDESKFSQCEDLSRDFEQKLKTDETDNPVNKISIFKEAVKMNKYAGISKLSQPNDSQPHSDFFKSWLNNG